MDAFYASVEQRDDPRLRGKPLVVGGDSRRGVVAAASYEARRFGIRSAMSMVEAKRRCPHAIVVPPRIQRYADVSFDVFAVFRRFTPLVEGLSLDEAFLDVTASRALFGDGETIARRIKSAIREELGLVASAGVAPCKFVAKIASDLEKPDALVVVAPERVNAFLGPLPIERMWGVGPKTAPKLRAMGLATLGDLARADRGELERSLGSFGPQAQALARGEDDRPVVPDGDAKSVGAECTYDEDLIGKEAIAQTLLEHAARVARRLVHENLSATVVTVKVKFADFTLASRQVSLAEPISDTTSIHRAAVALLDRIPLARRRVRLTGVSVAGLASGPPPPTLFPDPAIERGRKLEGLLADVASRFGDGGLTRAALLPEQDRARADTSGEGALRNAAAKRDRSLGRTPSR
jgi:DNA polymerase-4